MSMVVNERVLAAILTMLGAHEVMEDAKVDVDAMLGDERTDRLMAIMDGSADEEFDWDANLDVAKRLLIEAVDVIIAEQDVGEATT